MLAGAEARLLGSPGLGADALARLQAARVAVIGAGMLGGQVAHHLGLLGVSQVIIDCGRVAVENLGNQLFPFASLGTAKSIARARQITALNPECRVCASVCRVEALGLAALAGVDLIASGLDSRASRVRVSEIAWRLGIPWVDAAVDGSGRWLRGTVTVYDPRCVDAPCYLCGHDRTDLAAIAREGRGPGCPSWRRTDAAFTPPTLQASAFGAIVAGFQTLQITRVLLGCSGDLVGQQLVVECDGPPRTRLLKIAANQRCLFAHRRLHPLRVPSGETVGDLLADATSALGTPPEELLCHGRALVTGLVCPRCATTRDLVRVDQACSDDDVRCNCPPPSEMAPTETTERLAGPILHRVANLTWRGIGLPSNDVVTAAAAGRQVHYVVNRLPQHSDWG